MRQSRLSIQKFGWQFWLTDTWDPVAGEFGARPFIWGTLYSSVLALLHRRRRSRSASPSSSPSWRRRGCARRCVFLTELLAAIPSIVYGLWGIFVLVPLVRSLETATPGVAARHCRCSAARRSASACWPRR